MIHGIPAKSWDKIICFSLFQKNASRGNSTFLIAKYMDVVFNVHQFLFH